MTYSVTESVIESEGKKYTVYGVRCDEASVENFSADKKEAETFAALCNKHSLSPVHLPEAAEDFLCEIYS